MCQISPLTPHSAGRQGFTESLQAGTLLIVAGSGDYLPNMNANTRQKSEVKIGNSTRVSLKYTYKQHFA
jgi:hypothetical protein